MLTALFSSHAFASSGMSKNIDIKKNPIYTVYSFQKLYDTSHDISRENRDRLTGDYFSVYAKVDSIGKENNKIICSDPARKSSGTLTIVARTAHAADELVKLSAGDKVKIFGSITGANNKTLTLELNEITKETNPSAVLPDYEFSGGKNGGKKYYSSRSAEIRLGDGAMKCRIPDSWSAVQQAADNDLDGYKFCLNDAESDKKKDPELVYLFYFDYDKYVYTNYKNDDNKIEAAIIRNILPDELLLLYIRNNQKLFGRYIDHYVSKYGAYNVEFFFSKASSDGLACIVYLYGNYDVHSDDIMYVLRTLETE